MTDYRKKIPLLIAHARANPTEEAIMASAMFERFVSNRFSYDEISNRPDCPVYASAEVLAVILPLIIDEMLARGDTGNYLVYPIIGSIDPFGQGRSWVAERTSELVDLATKETVAAITKFLHTVTDDPPVPIERLNRLIAFWEGKAKRFGP